MCCSLQLRPVTSWRIWRHFDYSHVWSVEGRREEGRGGERRGRGGNGREGEGRGGEGGEGEGSGVEGRGGEWSGGKEREWEGRGRGGERKGVRLVAFLMYALVILCTWYGFYAAFVFHFVSLSCAVSLYLQVPEYCSDFDEEEVLEHSFELIFAFDEIVALGNRAGQGVGQGGDGGCGSDVM